MLLRADADADKPTRHGYTPLALAARVSRKALSCLLSKAHHHHVFCLVSSRKGMLRLLGCCSERVRMLTSPHVMAMDPWLWLQE